MFQPFLKTLKVCVKKPWIFIPAILGNIVLLGLSALIFQSLSALIIDLILNNTSTHIAPHEIAIRLLQTHLPEIAILTLGALAISYLSILLFYIYARFAREVTSHDNASLLTAVKFSFGKLKDIFYIVLFIAMLELILFAVFQLILTFTASIPIVGIALGILLILLVVYAMIKFMMFVPIITDGKSNLKNALKKSWQFSEKNLIGNIIVVVWIATYMFIIERALDHVLGPSENYLFIAGLLIVVYGVLTTITLSFISFFYFQHHQQEKTGLA